MVNKSFCNGFRFSWNKETKAKFGFGVQTGAFVTNSVMLLIEGAAEWTSPVDKYTLGVGVVTILTKRVYMWNRLKC